MRLERSFLATTKRDERGTVGAEADDRRKEGRSFKKMFSSKKKKTGGKGGFRGLDGTM